MRPILAWGMMMVMLAAWGGFGALFWSLEGDRAEYAEAAAQTEEESAHGETIARLHSTIQSTEAERTALESLVNVSILDAVKTIEAAVKQAGASDVKIGDASAQAATAQKLSNVSVVVTASGSFAAVMRAVSLLETVPLPAAIEQFDVSKSDDVWHLSARLRVTLAAEK